MEFFFLKTEFKKKMEFKKKKYYEIKITKSNFVKLTYFFMLKKFKNLPNKIDLEIKKLSIFKSNHE